LSVTEQVRADITRAMKAGEKDLVGALRLLLSELQKDQKEGAGDELAVLRRERKRRLEAASQFEAGHRPDLALKEESEAKLIDAYLPEDLDDQQLAALVGDAIAQAGASSTADFGRVMKLVMERAGGLVEGKRASAAVREALSA
jgi:uncharacterized protein YqeY